MWSRARWVGDACVALGLLILLAPALALVASAIRIVDGPPVFVRLPRVGRHGNEFGMLKLRTMRVGGGNALAPGARITAGSDPRITMLGRQLRRWRLDELPQLAHVIRGAMAIIGPRPEIPELVESAHPDWKVVLAVRPGIAGMTQVLVADIEEALLRHGSQIEMYRSVMLPVKRRLDAFYVEHAGPRLDLLVVVALVTTVLLRRRPRRLEAYVNRHSPDLHEQILDLRCYVHGDRAVLGSEGTQR